MNNEENYKILTEVKNLLLQAKEKNKTDLNKNLTEEEILNPNDETIAKLKNLLDNEKNEIERLDLNL